MNILLFVFGMTTFFIGFFGSLANVSTGAGPAFSPIMSFFLGMVTISFFAGVLYVASLEDALTNNKKSVDDPKVEKS